MGLTEARWQQGGAGGLRRYVQAPDEARLEGRLDVAPQPDSGPMSAPLDAWLTHICGLVPGVSAALVVTREGDDGPWKPAAGWPLDAPGSDDLLEVAQLAAESGRPVLRGGAPDAGRHDVAAPLGDLAVGHESAVAIAVADAAQETLLTALRTIQAGIAWLPFVLRSGRQALPPALARLALDLVATSHDHARFQAAATSMVTELATRLGCERVSLGLVERGQLHLCAVSHSARFDERSKLLQGVVAAMEEAIDQEALVLDPPPPGAEPLLRRAHEALRAHGPDSVCSVPVAAHGTVTGALTFELSPGRELARGRPPTATCGRAPSSCSRGCGGSRRRRRAVPRRAPRPRRACSSAPPRGPAGRAR